MALSSGSSVSLAVVTAAASFNTYDDETLTTLSAEEISFPAHAEAFAFTW
jgi:hypothetical protein